MHMLGRAHGACASGGAGGGGSVRAELSGASAPNVVR